MIYEVKKLSFSYDNSKTVLKNINLELNQGELLCVLGKNGSGKTTLFKCLLGILNADSGEIILNNRNIKDLKEKEIAKNVGYVSQNNESTFAFTVYEYVMMGLASSIGIFSKPSTKQEEMVINILKEMNLLEFKDRLFNELSGGERQQVAIARALVLKPDVILFDEPTAHLDYGNQIKVLRMIKELSKKGYAIMITTHDPNHAIMLDGSVALLDNNGHLVKGSAEELISEDNLKKIYGTDLKIKYIEEFKRKVCIYQM